MAIAFLLLLVEQIDLMEVIIVGIGVGIGISLALGGYFFLWARRQPAAISRFSQETMVVCGVCRTRLLPDSLFCHECGNPIGSVQATEGHPEYERYLRRLDELRKTGSISDAIYTKLRKEFEEKREHPRRSAA